MNRKLVMKLCLISLLIVFAVLLMGCSNESENNSSETIEKQNAVLEQPSGLVDGFPKGFPFFKGSEVMECENYGDSSFTLIFTVNEDFEKVLDFYMNYFEDADSYMESDGESYFEGYQGNGFYLKGLTITDNGSNTMVYAVIDSDEVISNIDSNESEEVDYSSDVMTYDTAVVEALSDNYPSDVVPIYPDAKVIACSLAPSGSGFVNLILPYDGYDSCVSYYQEIFGEEGDSYETQIMKSVSFAGTKEDYRYTVSIGHQMANNDPLVVITVDK
ncbi:MAG: hypothetical protein JXR88_18760 [Clostridia bacterium]|nr:hypothetical protein [Clostridia bacterium]